MNAAAASAIDPIQHNVSDLLDILYEILASGLEPEGACVSSSDIETFLHQHARSPKTRPEMEAFFQQAGLPTQIDSFVRDSGLRLASVSAITGGSGAGDLNAPEGNTGRHAVTQSVAAPRPVAPVVPVAIEAAAITTSSERSSSVRLWTAVSVVCAALLVACVFGGLALMNLRDQQAAAAINQQQVLAAIESLKTRTENVDARLNDQAKVIDATNANLDRLVESFLPAAE